MQSFTADDDSFRSRDSSQIRPALTSFADEVSATVARLFAYVGVLMLFGILGVHAWNQMQFEWVAEDTGLKIGWSPARIAPDFALSQDTDKSIDSSSYLALRHSQGGRRDVFRWPGPLAQPGAELEIYRPGAEYGSVTTARVELASRMPASGSRRGAELEPAGTIESKFGTVALLRRTGTSCLGFLKRIDAPALQISGWSCQGESLATRRDGIDCMLSRLVLARSADEPKLARLFGHAEVSPANCPSATVTADWVNSTDAPILRGSL